MVCGHNGTIHLEIRILVTSGFVEPPLERELVMEKPWRFWRGSAPSTGQLARHFQAGMGSSHSELAQVQVSIQLVKRKAVNRSLFAIPWWFFLNVDQMRGTGWRGRSE